MTAAGAGFGAAIKNALLPQIRSKKLAKKAAAVGFAIKIRQPRRGDD